MWIARVVGVFTRSQAVAAAVIGIGLFGAARSAFAVDLLEPRLRAAMAAAEPKSSMDSVRESTDAPDRKFKANVDAKIDLFIDAPAEKDDNEPALIAVKPAGPVEVKVMQWIAKEDPTVMVTLVFRQDRLWYAIVPISASEETPKELVARFGDPPKKVELAKGINGRSDSAKLYAYPDRGIGYVHTGGSAFAFKVLFPEGTRSSEILGASSPQPKRAVARPSVTPPMRPTPIPGRPSKPAVGGQAPR